MYNLKVLKLLQRVKGLGKECSFFNWGGSGVEKLFLDDFLVIGPEEVHQTVIHTFIWVSVNRDRIIKLKFHF
jgi:hypothetical protein